MLAPKMLRRQWSELGRLALIWSIVAVIGLGIADGIVHASYIANPHDNFLIMLNTWIYDFRILADTGIYSAAIVFVGAKFFETRTVVTVAFDTLDAARRSIKGPDGDNYVWIGRKYGTAFEAETVVAALESRMRESAVASAASE
jgi:hypothetical protein